MASPDEIEVERRIADRMRSIRKEKGLTLSHVAAQAGLSSGHLSRIESGARQPSIGTLVLIARSLGVTLADVLAEENGPDPVIVRSAEATRHRRPEGVYARLSGRLDDGVLEVLRLDLDPEAVRISTRRHPGEEWIHVLTGTVTLELGTARYELHPGDAAHFQAEQPHRLSCDGPASVLVVIAAPERHDH